MFADFVIGCQRGRSSYYENVSLWNKAASKTILNWEECFYFWLHVGDKSVSSGCWPRSIFQDFISFCCKFSTAVKVTNPVLSCHVIQHKHRTCSPGAEIYVCIHHTSSPSACQRHAIYTCMYMMLACWCFPVDTSCKQTHIISRLKCTSWHLTDWLLSVNSYANKYVKLKHRRTTEWLLSIHKILIGFPDEVGCLLCCLLSDWMCCQANMHWFSHHKMSSGA